MFFVAMADRGDSSYTRVKIIWQDRIEDACLEIVLFVADSSNSKCRLSEETRKSGIALTVVIPSVGSVRKQEKVE